MILSREVNTLTGLALLLSHFFYVSLSAQVLGDALRIKDAPTTQLYQAFEEAGTDLAQVRLHRLQVSRFSLRR